MITLAYLLVCIAFAAFAVFSVVFSWVVYAGFVILALVHMWAAWVFRKEA